MGGITVLIGHYKGIFKPGDTPRKEEIARELAKRGSRRL